MMVIPHHLLQASPPRPGGARAGPQPGAQPVRGPRQGDDDDHHHNYNDDDDDGDDVQPAFEEFCFPTKKWADVIVPRGAENTVALNLIQQYIQVRACRHLNLNLVRLRHYLLAVHLADVNYSI